MLMSDTLTTVLCLESETEPSSGQFSSGEEGVAAARVMRLQDTNEETNEIAVAVTASSLTEIELNTTLCSATNYLFTNGENASAVTEGLSPGIEATLITCLSFMIVITIVGNVLVVLSVLLVKKLRHPSSNYLLVSLAISDLCVATLVMPLALYSEISNRQAKPGWGLGPTICNLWVSFDVTCCTASILNLCVISIDRYLAITRPLTYGVSATTKRTLCFIAAIWVASCLISVPPLLVLGNEHGTKEMPTCIVSQNIGYQLYATLGAFYIPLTVMIVMYYKIYIAAKRVVEAEAKAQPAGQGTRKRPSLLSRSRSSNSHTNKSDPAMEVLNNQKHVIHEENDNIQPPTLNDNYNGASRTGLLNETSESHNRLHRIESARRRTSSSALRERKASITLGVIMTAFTVCWLPFFILALLRPFSFIVEVSIPDWVVSVCLWLGYANSMLNPIIYVTFHQDFRRAFRYLLCLQCATLDTRMREEAYQTQYGQNTGQYGGRASSISLTHHHNVQYNASTKERGQDSQSLHQHDWTRPSSTYYRSKSGARSTSPEMTSFEVSTHEIGEVKV